MERVFAIKEFPHINSLKNNGHLFLSILVINLPNTLWWPNLNGDLK